LRCVLDLELDIRIGFAGGDCHLVITYSNRSFYVRNEKSLRRFITDTAPFITRADLFRLSKKKGKKSRSKGSEKVQMQK